jgi:hypothetical protein
MADPLEILILLSAPIVRLDLFVMPVILTCHSAPNVKSARLLDPPETLMFHLLALALLERSAISRLL